MYGVVPVLFSVVLEKSVNMISGMQHCDVIGIIGCGCAGCCIGFATGSVGYIYGLDIRIRKSFSDVWNLFVSSVGVHG